MFPIGGATPVIRAVPTEPRVVVPTLPQVIQPTMPLVQPTLPPLQPPVQPTLPPIQPTLPLPAQPTLPLVQPTQPPPAAPKARLAFTVRRGDRPEDNYIWIMNADGSGAKEILKRASEPTFSPDGSKIAFYQWTDGIFVANADGTEPKKILGESNAGYMSWSHDGRWIAFSVRTRSIFAK
jgi:hypothetical protein